MVLKYRSQLGYHQEVHAGSGIPRLVGGNKLSVAKVINLIGLVSGQFADMDLSVFLAKAKGWGYRAVELATWGKHFDVVQATGPDGDKYCAGVKDLFAECGLVISALSAHLVGQAVCSLPTKALHNIVPDDVWGDGTPADLNRRAAERVKLTAQAAKNMGLDVVTGFTGSRSWPDVYPFPDPKGAVQEAYEFFGQMWSPILDYFGELGVRFAMEVHPTEVAMDAFSMQLMLEAVGNHPNLCLNYDPSHLAWQNVDYVGFIYEAGERIVHAHMKDVWVAPTPTRAGWLGGHSTFGDRNRSWDFRSLGRGSVNFEEVWRAMLRIGYGGVLAVEWEDIHMDREHGAEEACGFLRRLVFPPSDQAFDAAFSEQA